MATRLLQLRSGRQIAIEESGDPAGVPVFFFHGWPASRLQGAGFGVEAAQMGLRIIATDRPGIGLSTYQPGRTLLDWPPVIGEVADQLGIERFHVLAISGGGPYALATAHGLPDRTDRVVIVSGAPPLGPDTDSSSLLPAYRALLWMYWRRPGLLRWMFQKGRPLATLSPPKWLRPFLLRTVPAADRSALAVGDVFEGSFQCYREAWRGHPEGVLSDGCLYAENWGFAPEAVQKPICLWHGMADRSFSWRLVEALAQRLPHCQTRFIADEGHYSLPIRHKRAILEEIAGKV